ncbi:MAG TPA: endonuclease/exonuclease/phosphatase family protein [Gammaproteobacteria bacterium]|nr:endonuclease/exonuclease/phosphatase family protein [Gammaproteobacteria bacterium]
MTGCGAATVPQIQGAGHESPWAGRTVRTTGVVTATAARGFYLQDPTGDGDPATSDAVFVFTAGPARVSVGDRLEVAGTVHEFVPGGERTGNRSVTELTRPSLSLLDRGVPLPAEIVLGAAGRWPPASGIGAAADFFESIEGMRVRVTAAVAVSPLNDHGEIFVRAAGMPAAAGLNARGGLTIAEGDFNPERVQVQLGRDTLRGARPGIDVGAKLADVTGVIGYAFGNYELRITTTFAYEPSTLERERTSLVRSADKLTIASFNAGNLGPHSRGDGRHDLIVRQIAVHLCGPDILALQEIQDDDGAADSGHTAATGLMRRLIERLAAAGAPRYRYADIAPADGEDGGQPGANIRAGFLYDPSRVTLVDGSLRRIGHKGEPAFAQSRKPLLAEFRFGGRRLAVINVHLASRRGSTPLFGRVRPPIVSANAQRRETQAAIIAAEVDRIATSDAGAEIVVLGDFNDFDFSPPLRILGAAGGGLVNLVATLPERERYTYIYEGNSQALDHVLVSESLAATAEVDIVHFNAEFAVQSSDHDPVLVRLRPGNRNAGP